MEPSLTVCLNSCVKRCKVARPSVSKRRRLSNPRALHSQKRLEFAWLCRVVLGVADLQPGTTDRQKTEVANEQDQLSELFEQLDETSNLEQAEKVFRAEGFGLRCKTSTDTRLHRSTLLAGISFIAAPLTPGLPAS